MNNDDCSSSSQSTARTDSVSSSRYFERCDFILDVGKPSQRQCSNEAKWIIFLDTPPKIKIKCCGIHEKVTMHKIHGMSHTRIPVISAK